MFAFLRDFLIDIIYCSYLRQRKPIRHKHLDGIGSNNTDWRPSTIDLRHAAIRKRQKNEVKKEIHNTYYGGSTGEDGDVRTTPPPQRTSPDTLPSCQSYIKHGAFVLGGYCPGHLSGGTCLARAFVLPSWRVMALVVYPPPRVGNLRAVIKPQAFFQPLQYL